MPATPHLSMEVKSFLALKYAETKSPKQVLALFQEAFPNEPVPSKGTPRKLFLKLEQKHSLEYLYPKEIKKRVSRWVCCNFRV